MSLSEPAARPAIMHDVARLAGVSHQTVSRVLNGHPNVRPETRERVLEAIRRLNYRPNALARGLVTRRSQTIGVISFDTRLFGPASTLLAIEHAARAAGYTITISSLANLDASSVRAAVDALAGQSVDGVIVIAPRESAARGLRDLRPGLPVVAVEAGYGGEIPVVSVDQFAGARLAVDHLLSLGHRTVWHVAGPADWLEARERVEGWQASLTGAGVAAPPALRGDWSPDSGYQAGLELAANPDVTAVFAANDQMALGVLHAFYERGVQVPGGARRRRRTQPRPTGARREAELGRARALTGARFAWSMPVAEATFAFHQGTSEGAVRRSARTSSRGRAP